MKDSVRHTDVAIIGMAGRFPGAKNVDEFWRNVRDGVESVVFFSEEELLASGVLPAVLRQPNYIRARAALDDIELFDASFFGFNPKEAEIMDPQHRFFLECAWEALEHAGYDSEKYPNPIGVYAGVSMSTYLIGLYANREVAATAGSMQIRLGNDKDYLPTRVSYKLNLRGPSVNVQSACSTSLVAVQMAYQSLLNYQCDIALAGGVSIAVPQREGYSYREGGVGSRDGHCRAFDASADGTIGGSGVGIVVLKRLADALADGDSIHAVIRGAGINNDGSLKVGYTAPSVDGQAEVIATAQSVADVHPESIGYIEAHGTGTALGDPIEIAALTKVFRAGTKKKNFCGVGSVKTNIGHLDAAAGVTGLIKTVMALKHKMLPPSLNFEQPNPKINFDDSPFFVSTKLSNWQLPAGQDRRVAGVSAFGIGGTNVHLIVEEAPEISTAASDSSPWQLLVLSAKTEAALQRRISSLASHLQEHPELNLADVAHTLRVGRRAFEHRATLVCRDSADAMKALDSFDHQRIVIGRAKEQNHPVVFMFPGGGAQHVNMGRELYEAEPLFRNEVDNCAQLLKTSLNADLRDLLYPAEERTESAAQRLRQTSVALPALFTIEYALAKLWMSWGIKPQAMIGHSLGEYVAACLSGVISLKDVLSLVALRGRLFETLPPGAMLSVPLSEAELSPLMNGKLSIAAINGASQCVVSGESDAIDRFAIALNEREIETRRLHIDVAAHSQTVEPILDEFSRFVKKLRFNKPSIPYVSNVTGDWIASDEITPDYWRTHLRHTVRFADGLRQLATMSPIFLEVGPGQVLTALAQGASVNGQGKRILSSCRHPLDQQSDLGFLLNTLGRLWLAGVQIDWTTFGKGQERRRVPLPTYPFERHKYWIEPPRRGQVVNTNNVLRRKPDVADWFYLPSWKRTTQTYSLNGDRPQPENFLIFSDRCGVGAKLAQRLEEMGHRVVSVEVGAEFARRSSSSYAINPRAASDYDALVDELVANDKLPQRVIHLWSVTPDDSSDLFHGFYSLVFLLQAAGRRASSEKDTLQIHVVSNNMQEVNGDEHVIPEKIMVLGPVRVMSQEYPNVICRSIDIETGNDRTVDQLYAEIFTPATDQVVAYRGSHRWTQSFEPVRIKGSTTALRDEGVYVITGGSGNVGLVIAEWIAEQAQGAKLALLGRSTSPLRSRVEKLEELGAEVMFVRADVGDEQQMQAAFAEVESHFGTINGVIHAAGTVGSHSVASLGELTIESCEKQFHPKVQGVYVLERILRDKKLDFCLLTSSLASVLGGLRLGAYAAANLFMDSFVNKYRKTQSVPWISLNWDAWLFDRDKASAGGNAMAEFAITPPEGKSIMDKALSTPIHAQLIISTADLEARFKQWVNRVVAKESKQKDQAEQEATPLHPRPGLANEYVEPETKTQQTIAEIWKELLGIDQVGIHDNFFELGGHSLIGIHFIARLRQVFKVSGLHLNTLFESPTVAGISKTIDEATAAESKPASTSPLVLMQPEGSRPPIFCIHPIGGHVFRFVNLVKHLGNDHPFYGLQARGLADVASEGAHHQTIEEMAAEYIDAIQEVQPTGPYFIAGWSFGGFVAFEVAQQLRAKGETMGLLAIIDAPSPGNFVKITSIDDTALLLELARQRGHKAGKNGFVSARDLKGLTADEQFDYILNRMKEASLVPPDIGVPWLRHYMQGYRTRELAARNYKPRVYTDHITLFRASDIDPEAGATLRQTGVDFANPTFGWSDLCTQPIEVHTVPGYHETIVLEPNVQILAEKFKACLAAALAV